MRAVRAILRAARYAIPIYVGVGTTTQILTDFQVGLVTLTKVANDEAFLIPLVNIGMTPMRLEKPGLKMTLKHGY